jgi:hypothetical protein
MGQMSLRGYESFTFSFLFSESLLIGKVSQRLVSFLALSGIEVPKRTVLWNGKIARFDEPLIHFLRSISCKTK